MKVEYLGHLGSDEEVCDAARVSFNKVAENYTDNENERLIKYLAEHNHWSPFSHCYLKFRIKAPIFVARQLQKHTVGLAWNEISRRYVSSSPEFYYPDEWRGKPTNGAKQGSDGVVTISDDTDYAVYKAEQTSYQAYHELLEAGVAPEQARMVLPQSMITEWIWSGSLYAFCRVCNLRLDSHSQRETSEVARMISEYIREYFPNSYTYLVKS